MGHGASSCVHGASTRGYSRSSKRSAQKRRTGSSNRIWRRTWGFAGRSADGSLADGTVACFPGRELGWQAGEVLRRSATAAMASNEHGYGYGWKGNQEKAARGAARHSSRTSRYAADVASRALSPAEPPGYLERPGRSFQDRGGKVALEATPYAGVARIEKSLAGIAPAAIARKGNSPSRFVVHLESR